MTNVTAPVLDTEARVGYDGPMNPAPVSTVRPSSAAFGCVPFASAWASTRSGRLAAQVGRARAAANGPIGAARWGADLTTWGGEEIDQRPRIDAHLAVIHRP